MATSTERRLRLAVVVDASVCLPWYLLDEVSPLSEKMLEQLSRLELWAPTLWRYEMANALLVATRRGRLKPEYQREMLDDADRLEVQIDPTLPSISRLAELANRHALTAYDASFLDLALRRRMPLATLDQDLRRAAPQAGVELFEL